MVVCFAPLLHEVNRNIILDHGSTADSVKSEPRSRDSRTSRIWLRKDPHRSVVGAETVHFCEHCVLGTHARFSKKPMQDRREIIYELTIYYSSVYKI